MKKLSSPRLAFTFAVLFAVATAVALIPAGTASAIFEDKCPEQCTPSCPCSLPCQGPFGWTTCGAAGQPCTGYQTEIPTFLSEILGEGQLMTPMDLTVPAPVASVEEAEEEAEGNDSED